MALNYMPRIEPAGWRERRRGWTWGILLLTVVVSLLLQWLAQIIGGAIVGANVGLEGIGRIDAADFASLNSTTWCSSGVITFVATWNATSRTYAGLTWSSWVAGTGALLGMDWWKSFWAPVLIGAAIHGVIFALAMQAFTYR